MEIPRWDGRCERRKVSRQIIETYQIGCAAKSSFGQNAARLSIDIETTLLIRRALPGDAATIADFGRRTFIDTFGTTTRAEDIEAYVSANYGETLQLREIEAADGATLLSESGGHPVAFAQLRLSEIAPERLDRPVELARFYVDREWHGRGVAQALMDAVEEEARAMGGATLWLGVWEHNARAIAFYRRRGFLDIGSHPFLLGTDLQTDREMAKMLSTPATRFGSSIW